MEQDKKNFLSACESVFKEIDQDRDNLITETDLEAFLHKKSHHFDDLVINQFLFKNNQKKNTFINFQDFYEMILKNKDMAKKDDLEIKEALSSFVIKEDNKEFVSLKKISEQMMKDYGIIINYDKIDEKVNPNEMSYKDFETFIFGK